MKEEGIYVSVSTHIDGPPYKALIAMMEKATKEWTESERGQKVIRNTVAKVIEDKISQSFNWYVKDDPRSESLKNIIVDAFYTEMFRMVPRATPPNDT